MIDWTVHDKYPEMTCSCVCQAIFRSHAKFVVEQGLISRKPCPRCGNNLLNCASSDPERFTIEDNNHAQDCECGECKKGKR